MTEEMFVCSQIALFVTIMASFPFHNLVGALPDYPMSTTSTRNSNMVSKTTISGIRGCLTMYCDGEVPTKHITIHVSKQHVESTTYDSFSIIRLHIDS